MKLGLYAIKDDLTGYKNITIADNDPVALRDFSYAVNCNEIIKLNTKNYSLYKLGVYDTELGVIDNTDCPQLLTTADACFREVNKN